MDAGVAGAVGFLETPITVLHIIVAIFMILVVLIQGGSSGGVSATLGGGGNSSAVLGATGATSLLGKLTYACAIMFMMTSISLCVIQGKKGASGIDTKKIEQYEQNQNKKAMDTKDDAALEAVKTEKGMAKPADQKNSMDSAPATVPADNNK